MILHASVYIDRPMLRLLSLQTMAQAHTCCVTSMLTHAHVSCSLDIGEKVGQTTIQHRCGFIARVRALLYCFCGKLMYAHVYSFAARYEVKRMQISTL